MTKAQIRAYSIANNKLAENAGWDQELVALELKYISELDIELDLTITGFPTGGRSRRPGGEIGGVSKVVKIQQEQPDAPIARAFSEVGHLPYPAVAHSNEIGSDFGVSSSTCICATTKRS
jgi:hypothetical protein